MKKQKDKRRPLWQLLVACAKRSGEGELNCEECLRVLDYYVDWILLGGDPTRVRMMVADHLISCESCRSELERKVKERERNHAIRDQAMQARVKEIWVEATHER